MSDARHVGNGDTPGEDGDEDEASPTVKPNASLFVIDSATLSKLLVALNECSEWGRIALLNTLATYRAQDTEESEHICERVMPQFQHNNAAVVLGAVKVIMVHMKNVHREDLLKQLTRKMAPPLGMSTKKGDLPRRDPCRDAMTTRADTDGQSPSSRPRPKSSGSRCATSTSCSKSGPTFSPTRCACFSANTTTRHTSRWKSSTSWSGSRASATSRRSWASYESTSG